MNNIPGLPGGCNPADVLYKLALGRGISPPVFVHVSEQGPPHARTFTWRCSFLEGQYSSTGQGRSKKEAKNESAKNLITQLDLNTLPQKQLKHQGGPKVGDKRKLGNENSSILSKQGKKKPLPLFGNSNGGFGSGPQFMGSHNYCHPMSGPGYGDVFQPGYGYSDSMGMPYGGQMVVMDDGMGFGYMNPMVGPGPWDSMMGMGSHFGEINNYFQPKVTVADKQVMSRHQEIYPRDEELEIVLELVDTIEKALKKISDNFLAKSGDEEREIKGVARVGDLAKGLLLTGDKEVNLVVMCNNKPTVNLLQNITEALKKELLELESTRTNYEVHMFPEEGGLCVTNSEKGDAEVPYQVTVTLTSTILRNQVTDDIRMKEGQEKIKDGDDHVKDLLPSDKGIFALAELRHSKWFSAVAANLPSCVETIRMMRDKVQRDISWSGLSGWATELLVERSIYSADRNLSPSSALKRVMEVVASGLLMPDGQGIQDPCEREETNVFDCLTRQMREDITKQAQVDLRNIHFRNIHLVLGSEKWENHKSSKQKKDGISSVDNDNVKSEEDKN